MADVHGGGQQARDRPDQRLLRPLGHPGAPPPRRAHRPPSPPPLPATPASHPPPAPGPRAPCGDMHGGAHPARHATPVRARPKVWLRGWLCGRSFAPWAWTPASISPTVAHQPSCNHGPSAPPDQPRRARNYTPRTTAPPSPTDPPPGRPTTATPPRPTGRHRNRPSGGGFRAFNPIGNPAHRGHIVE